MPDYWNLCRLCMRRIEIVEVVGEDGRVKQMWTHRDPFVMMMFEALHLPVPMV